MGLALAHSLVAAMDLRSGSHVVKLELCMGGIQVRGLDFVEIVNQLRSVLETAAQSNGGVRVLTTEALYVILDRCDDLAHAREPLAQALCDFIVEHEATIVLPRSVVVE